MKLTKPKLIKSKLTKPFLLILIPVTLLLVISLAKLFPSDLEAMTFQPDYGPLAKEVVAYLEKQPGTYGLYFIDLRSGQEFGYHQLTAFHAASTFKLPLNLYLYREASQDRLNLNEKLFFAPKHLEGGTGILQRQKTGGRYTIARLSALSIIYSDNVATNILLERLGRRQVKNFMRSLGGKRVSDTANITCPFDLALYMRETLDFSRSQAVDSKLLLNLLFDSRYKERLPAPLPQGIKVANKIGTWPPEHTYNDVAYVVHPERPYILAVTSRDTPGYNEALPVIRHLSQMVYDYQTAVAHR